MYDEASQRIIVGGYALADLEVLRGPDLSQVDYHVGAWTTPLTIYGGSGNGGVCSSRKAAMTFYGGAGDDSVSVGRRARARASGPARTCSGSTPTAASLTCGSTVASATT